MKKQKKRLKNKNSLKNTEHQKIKAIIFDIGGVLLLGDNEFKYGHQNIKVHRELAKRFGFSLKKWLEKIEKPYEKSITAEWSKNKILEEMSKDLDVSPEKLEKLIIKFQKKYYRKNQTLFKLVNKLKKDYIVGILSDQTYFSKKALIKKQDMELFNPVVISCDIGYRKPKQKIYRYLKKELDRLKDKKIKYSEILFIDNREFNLKPAKKLGMKTILFKTNKQAIKEINDVLNNN